MGESNNREKNSKLLWSGFGKTDPLYVEFVDSLCREYHNGYSVVQMTRVLDSTSALRTYKLLQSGGAIPALPRTRGRKYSAPKELVSVLEKCKLTYLQWCNSHGLDPEIAGGALLRPLDRWDPESLAAHNAYKNDWRRLYDRVFDPNNTPAHNFTKEKRPGLENRDAMIIAYDDKKLCFYACLEKWPDFRCYGKTRDDVYFAMKRRYILKASIHKLMLLPPHPGPAFLRAYEVSHGW